MKIKFFPKSMAILGCFLAMALALPCSAATIIASWDNFGTFNSGVASPDFTATGYTDVSIDGQTREIRTDGSGSDDGTFGSDFSGADTSANNGYLLIEKQQDGTVGPSTIFLNFTNNTGATITLDSINFDINNAGNSFYGYEVSFTNNATSSTTVLENNGSIPGDGVYVDVSLATGALTLEDGQSGTFDILFNDIGSQTNGSNYMDNIGVAVVPEPSTALLGGLSALLLLRRRR
jgi:hypothetical protein